MFTLKQKLMSIAIAIGLIVASFHFGKFVESNACQAKSTVKVLESKVKRKEKNDAIDKAVDRMDAAAVDRAYGHWVR